MNLFASVLHLDRSDVKALRITDPYSLHRVVYSLYEDIRSDEAKNLGHASGILYADQGGDHSGRKILLLADRRPAARVDDCYGSVKSKTIPEGFLDHTRYRFKVIINPTRRDNLSRKLVPIKSRDLIAQWFSNRAMQQWGFQVSEPHLQLDQIDVLQFADKQKNPITLAQARIQGQLTVTDSTRFRNSFARGIGRGRAFGCGLLQVVPMLDNPFSHF